MKTLTQFIAQSNISAKLIRSVVRQIGGWQSFKESANDVYNNGATCGFSGFTWYSDTEKFTKNNKKEIIELLKNESDEMGYNMTELLTSFRCFKGMSEHEILNGLYNPLSEDKTTVYNGMAWYALEEVARDYCGLTESN